MSLTEPLVPVVRTQVRAATADDLPALLRLWEELREAGGRPAREILAVPPDETEVRLRLALEDETYRIVVATVDDVVQGMAVLAPAHYGPLSGFRSVQLQHVIVSARHRRHGIGRGLVAAAAAYAEEVGADHVAVGVAPGLREPNRFYARLGFSPLAVRRVAPVAVLRRRLTTGVHPVASLEELTRRRLLARPRLRPIRKRSNI